MKKYIAFICALIAVILFAVVTHKPQSEDLLYVDIVRQDHPIKNYKGELIADIYYDKPLLQGNNESLIKINKFFEDEYLNWLNDTPSRINFYQSNEMERFLESVRNWRINNEQALIKQPFSNTIDTDVVFLSHDIISIRHDWHWMVGGVSSNYQFGYTFDLKTGELLPFTYFFDVKANDFKDTLFNLITESNLIDKSDEVKQEFIKKYYAPNSDCNFMYCSDGKTYDLSYEYYYDGKNINIILNEIMYNASVILKWNGELGDKFKGISKKPVSTRKIV